VTRDRACARIPVARVVVLAALCMGTTCTSRLPPGETRNRGPEAIRKALRCDSKTLPFFVVDRNTVTPRVVSGGDELRHIVIYSMCPSPTGEVYTGRLVRRIKLDEVTILDDVTEPFELKPGRWIQTALIRVPPDAPAGKYRFVTLIEVGTLRFDGEQRFEIKGRR
jgi:hypothetical protein